MKDNYDNSKESEMMILGKIMIFLSNIMSLKNLCSLISVVLCLAKMIPIRKQTMMGRTMKRGNDNLVEDNKGVTEMKRGRRTTMTGRRMMTMGRRAMTTGGATVATGRSNIDREEDSDRRRILRE